MSGEVQVRIRQRSVYQAWDQKTRQKWVIFLEPSGSPLVITDYETREEVVTYANELGFVVVEESPSDHEGSVFHKVSTNGCHYVAVCSCGLKSPNVDDRSLAVKWIRYHRRDLGLDTPRVSRAQLGSLD
jgi:hypothetical protein